MGSASPKAPYDPDSLLANNPQLAKAGTPATWSSFQAATECVSHRLARGIGFQFEGNDLYGVDLDHVIGKDGAIMPEAYNVVCSLDSYTEISPSGTGLHIFVLAPDVDIVRHRKKDHFIEIYNKGRYFTVTGNTYGAVKNIESRTQELQYLHNRFLLPTPTPSRTEVNPQTSVSNASNDKFLHIGLQRDKVFAQLWDGNRRNGNESSDDIALMNKLAYWCNANPDAMIRAFISSPHYTQKDEAHLKKCSRNDYLPNTAQKACSTVYSTAIADYEQYQRKRKIERNYAR
ncbi:MAG: hypothetical protein FWD05_08320 [Oscillospiraceae bacterium]|nr:hypothetical protein [Oscillospiraceae bacterium]